MKPHALSLYELVIDTGKEKIVVRTTAFGEDSAKLNIKQNPLYKGVTIKSITKIKDIGNVDHRERNTP